MTDFDNSEHWAIFTTNAKLTSSSGFFVRYSEIVLAALRAAGVFNTMEDGTTAPATDKLWLDKNFDPAVLKEWDATGSSWVPVTYGRLFGRAAVDNLTVTGGTANAVVVSAPAGFQGSRLYLITPTATNDAATTIQVSGVGTYNVKYGDGSDIDASEFTAGRQAVLYFTGSRFEVVFPVGELNTAVTDAEAFAVAASGFATAADGSATDAAASAAAAAAAALAVLTGAASDNSFAFTDELIYLTGSDPKRGTVTGLAALLVPAGWVAAFAMNTAPSGWLKANGAAISRTTYAGLFAAIVKSSIVTISIASPGVVSWASHGLSINDPVVFTTTGALPTGLVSGTTYYVTSAGFAADSFRVSATPGGAAINTSGSQSGVHTAESAPFGRGDGSTTFNVPDMRGEFQRGWDDSRGVDTNRAFGSAQLDAFQGHFHRQLMSSAGAIGSAPQPPGSTSANNGLSLDYNITAATTDGVNGTPRTAAETRGRNLAFQFCIKF